MWWEQINDGMKDIVHKLLSNNQLEFVNGGYVMHDEALPDFMAMVNQMTEGHEYLMKTLGVKPRVGWSIDPFGASRINPVINKLMGMQYHVINRVDDRLKYEFDNIPDSGVYIQDKSFEFYWQGSQNYGQYASIFTHILDHHYTSPVYCHNGTCTGFDFEGNPEENPPITSLNLEERADLLVSIIRNISLSYRTRNVLIPFGNDFRFQNPNIEFDNMDMLIYYINSNPSYQMKLQYATLSEYFDTVMRESDPSLFPVKLWKDKEFPDYFPYTNCWASDLDITKDNCIAYWSGYYTSHPEFKGLVREAERVLRTAEIIFALGVTQRQNMKYLEEKMVLSANQGLHIVWDDLYSSLTNLRTAIALAQHHDAITGTESTAALIDYENRLSRGMEKARELIKQLLSYFLIKNFVRPNLTFQSHHISNGQIFTYTNEAPIVLYNSLGWARSEYVYVNVNTTGLDVISHDAEIVPSEIIEYKNERTLFFLATVPPLGFNTYFIRNRNTTTQAPTVPKYNRIIELQNEFLIASFEAFDTLNPPYVLKSVKNKITGELVEVDQQYMYYTSWSDGAYIFRPTSDAQPLKFQPSHVSVKLFNGNHVQELKQQLTNNVTQIFRLYNGYNDPEVSFFIEMITVAAVGDNKELISRFSLRRDGQSLNTTLFTDSNSFEMTERPFIVRFNDTIKQSLIAGNYYPMVRSAFIQENIPNGIQFTVMSRQSMGVASLKSGSFEFMINRNSLTDDGRGLNQNLNVTQSVTIAVRFMIASRTQSEDIRPRVATLFDYPIDQLYVIKYANDSDNSSISYVPNRKEWGSYYNAYQAAMSGSLPRSIMLSTLQVRENATMIYNMSIASFPYNEIVVRLHHQYSIHSDILYSHMHSIFLPSLFEGYSLSNIMETTLSLMHVLNYNVPDVIRIAPGRIRTFVMRMEKIGQMNDDLFGWFQAESFLFGVGTSLFTTMILLIFGYIIILYGRSRTKQDDIYEELE
jgi:lysosomal alpha-mannosidase